MRVGNDVGALEVGTFVATVGPDVVGCGVGLNSSILGLLVGWPVGLAVGRVVG